MKSVSCFAAKTKNLDLLMSSTSGGVFAELAQVALAKNGLVVGASWEQSTFRVVHRCVDNVADIKYVQGSKYSVSDLSNVFDQIRKALSNKRIVLFSGTPCQTAAVRKIFGNNPYLYLVSLICMANADANLWLQYVKELKKRFRSDIVDIRQRCKFNDKAGTYFVVKCNDPAECLVESLYENKYWKQFISHPRHVCQHCQFKCGKGMSDLQIGDFWGIHKCLPDFDSKYGVSAIIVYTNKGNELLDQSDLLLQEVGYDQILKGNPYLEKSYIWKRESVVAMIKARIRMVMKSFRKFIVRISPYGKRRCM